MNLGKIIYDQIWSANTTADITVIQSSKVLDYQNVCQILKSAIEDTLKWFLGNVSLTQNQNFFLPTYEKIYVEDKMLLIVIVLSGQLVPKLQITISWYKLEMKVSRLSKLSKLFKTKNKLSFGSSIGEIFDIRMCLP